jgi:arabinofuranosyltransferase
VATSWADEGRKVRHEIEAEGSSRRVIERSTIGLFGFYAGPRAVIVDRLGLADPLLARLPTANPKAWRIGHFVRQVPQGYMATRETGTNVIEDQDLSRYYDRLREVVAGELWSLSRLRTLLALNAGRFEPLMKAYVARSGPPK